MRKMFTKIYSHSIVLALTFSAFSGNGQTMMALPAQSQVQTAIAEPTGYWFVAPVDFIITGLKMPPDAGTGTQSMQVIKVNDNAPVFFSTNFVTLYYVQNAPNNVIQPTNIQVMAGDTIGILGMTSGGTTSIYDGGSGTFSASIGPGTTNLKFLNAMNMELYLDSATNYNAHDADIVGRIEMYYALCVTPTSTVSASICKGEHYVFGTQQLDTAGTYTKTFQTAENACDSTVILTLSVINIDTSVTRNQATLTANAVNAGYQWINCNNGNMPIPGKTNMTFQPDQNGNYAVIITQNGCSDTSSCYSVQGLDITEMTTSSFVRLYPNPATSSVNILLEYYLRDASIRLTDAIGQVMFRDTQIHGNNLSIDISNYADGLYFVEITEGARRSRAKFIKQ